MVLARSLFTNYIITFFCLAYCDVPHDVVFIADSSGSVATRFSDYINFFKKFIDGFNIGEENAHAGYLKFADEPSIVFGLVDVYEVDIMKAFIERDITTGGLTFIDKALLEADAKLFELEHGWRGDKVISVSKPQKKMHVQSNKMNI